MAHCCHLLAHSLKVLPKSLIAVGFALAALSTQAQQPFNTDDIGVTDYHKFHMEFANEYDWLRQENLPNLRQNTANFKVAFGAWHHLEVGLDEQLLAISNQPTVFLPHTAFGYGDVDFSVKYN